MRIENELYFAVIDVVRVPNWHDRTRFHYTITRRSATPQLMVSGTAATQAEATSLVQQHLRKFAEHEARQRENGLLAS